MAARLTEERVRAVLRDVIDPELGVNIVDLGLIYGVDLAGDRVDIRMTMTTPGCPAANYIEQEVWDRLLRLPGVAKVRVEVVGYPPWSPDRMSEEARRALGFF